MGGDKGPEEIVAGALEAASDSVVPVPSGPKGLDTQGLELVEATETIEMHEKPVEAVRSKPQSSLVLACRAVGAGEADAVVSAGNTGATLAAGLFHIRRLPEVDRPAIAVVIPAATGPRSCSTPARTRSAPSTCSSSPRWARSSPTRCSRSPTPTCGCSRSARSPRKATSSRSRRTRSLPRATSTSAATSRAATFSKAGDVVVCDGFTGNVCLKLLEGTISVILEGIRDEIRSSTSRGKIGAS